jgi:hypothetical protein
MDVAGQENCNDLIALVRQPPRSSNPAGTQPVDKAVRLAFFKNLLARFEILAFGAIALVSTTSPRCKAPRSSGRCSGNRAQPARLSVSAERPLTLT